MKSLQLCRGCDRKPRVRGSLYCPDCKLDMDSFTSAAQRREHAREGCWCPDCTMSEQRDFRFRQANIRKARALAEAASRPPYLDPDPNAPGPRAA